MSFLSKRLLSKKFYLEKRGILPMSMNTHII